ncbi:DinB family protein [Neolewinella antarctica]|uniref:DinB-like domain-containing protein n=1 Tax=Neolewinella antarctica TaxID=442734 RepID=A0ABX0XE87_9BACT|nr:DinB family protein [Neolewinella antarctica]NJC27517.1 hypothetical protein [Neolewinella antarctica]
MSPRNTTELLEKLTTHTNRHLASARSLLALPDKTLHLRPRPESWNALECLAHLNHYGDYYLPEIRHRIETTKHNTPQPTYTSSWLGNKFATALKPGPKTRKISTFKSANPVNFATEADRTTIDEFIRQQEETLDLLQRAASVDLTRTKTGISISQLLKLRLCDTLRILIYHNWRHVEQAQRACDLTD